MDSFAPFCYPVSCTRDTGQSKLCVFITATETHRTVKRPQIIPQPTNKTNYSPVVLCSILHIWEYEENWYFSYKAPWAECWRKPKKRGVTLLLCCKALNLSLLTIFPDKYKGQKLLSHDLKYLYSSIAQDTPHWMLGGSVMHFSLLYTSGLTFILQMLSSNQ